MPPDDPLAIILQGLRDGFYALFRHWAFWLLAGLLALLRVVVAVNLRRPLQQIQLPHIDRMSRRQFRRYLARLFQHLGYRVERQPGGQDYGAGLILVRDGQRVLVLVKRLHRPLTSLAIDEAVAARLRYRCQHAMVVTNQPATRIAQDTAAARGVTVWDRDKLAAVIRTL